MSEVSADIESLRSLVTNARSMPMSASAVINRSEFLEAIDRLQQNVANASSASDAVLAERDSVLAEGEEVAIEMVRRAELDRDQLASDTEIFRVASHQAEALLAAAAEEAEELRRDADTYVEQRFSNFEHALERTLGEVRRGIANLAGRTSFDGANPGEAIATEDVLPSDPEGG